MIKPESHLMSRDHDTVFVQYSLYIIYFRSFVINIKQLFMEYCIPNYYISLIQNSTWVKP